MSASNSPRVLVPTAFLHESISHRLLSSSVKLKFNKRPCEPRCSIPSPSPPRQISLGISFHWDRAQYRLSTSSRLPDSGNFKPASLDCPARTLTPLWLPAKLQPEHSTKHPIRLLAFGISFAHSNCPGNCS